MRLHNTACDAQAEPSPSFGATARFVYAVESFEDMRLMFRRDADARVGDSDYGLSIFLCKLDGNSAVNGCVLDRVIEQVDDHLAQARLVSCYRPWYLALHLKL